MAASPVARIGCAGWSIPLRDAAALPGEGTHLQRYARHFRAVEINSSFHRSHRPGTYAKWAAAVPRDFRFAIKLPKSITHAARLENCWSELDRFCNETGVLGDKLGPCLVQLPPSLAFDAQVAARFFEALRQKFPSGIVCEPRHTSWLGTAAEKLLTELHVARVAADPVKADAQGQGAGEPGGWPGLRYWRLHGSPRMYYSPYSREALQSLAAKVAGSAAAGAETAGTGMAGAGMAAAGVWCIFDNTASGAALGNALELSLMLENR